MIPDFTRRGLSTTNLVDSTWSRSPWSTQKRCPMTSTYGPKHSFGHHVREQLISDKMSESVRTPCPICMLSGIMNRTCCPKSGRISDTMSGAFRDRPYRTCCGILSRIWGYLGSVAPQSGAALGPPGPPTHCPVSPAAGVCSVRSLRWAAPCFSGATLLAAPNFLHSCQASPCNLNGSCPPPAPLLLP